VIKPAYESTALVERQGLFFNTSYAKKAVGKDKPQCKKRMPPCGGRRRKIPSDNSENRSRTVMSEQIKRIKRELKFQGTILDFYQDTMEINGTHTALWDFIRHKGAAAVVPITEDGKILMVRQYRNALDRYTLEIPAGALDAEEEPGIVCAGRELEEETGFRCENLEWLITIRTTVAFCNERIEVYMARNLIPSKQHLDEDEFIDLKAYSIEELKEKIFSGEIEDGKTVSSLLAYAAKYTD